MLEERTGGERKNTAGRYFLFPQVYYTRLAVHLQQDVVEETAGVNGELSGNMGSRTNNDNNNNIFASRKFSHLLFHRTSTSKCVRL